MKVVIEIPDGRYNQLMTDDIYLDMPIFREDIIATLPKGHGKLKDVDKISARLEQLRDSWNYYGNEYEGGMYNGYDRSLDEIDDAPTIIEADSEEDGLDNLDSMLEDLWNATESEVVK